MTRKRLVTFIIAFIMAGAVIQPALASNTIPQPDLAQVRAANAIYHNTEIAMGANYKFIPGLDYCFSSSAGGMGYHLINAGMLDGSVDPLHPEALVYAPSNNGILQLVAVEYIVPISAVTGPPTLFGQTFDTNTTLGVYTLHAWIFRENPLGMFNDWNPKVSCP